MSGLTRFCSLALTGALLASCGLEPPQHIVLEGSDPANGRLLLRQFGCGSCHRIPGVADARGEVGPPLDQLAARVYLAGKIPNNPANLIGFIRDPQRFAPGTAMPDLSVGAEHARDMTAWLLSAEAQR